MVTVQPSLGFSSNGLTLGGFADARRCLCTQDGVDACQLDDQGSLIRLDVTQRGGLKRHVRNAPKVLEALESLGTSVARREAYAAKLGALAVEFRLVEPTEAEKQAPSTPPQ